MENIFKVEINPTFVAEVKSNARNWKRLNNTTPVIPIRIKGRIAFRDTERLFSFHQTIGTRNMTAIPHLNVVNVIGEA